MSNLAGGKLQRVIVGAGQVEAPPAACDRSDSVGRRDLTVIACLQRLGCVAAKPRRCGLMTSTGGDGTVTVRGKGNRSDRLPPPVDVGTLVADYPTEGRPDTAARTVFVRARPAAWPNTCAPSGRHSQCCPNRLASALP
ncbi:MAG: hypothetical protein QOC62_5076 [Mycobacterium sp.]|nr:hypothetical protein [Mycobacterium sp.]